jgi:hypothetical protein
MRRSVCSVGRDELRHVRPHLLEHADLLERHVYDWKLRGRVHELQWFVLRSDRTQEQLRHVRPRMPGRPGLLEQHVPLSHGNGIVRRRPLPGREQRRGELRGVRHAVPDGCHVHERRVRLPERRDGVFGLLLRRFERRSPLWQLHHGV